MTLSEASGQLLNHFGAMKPGKVPVQSYGVVNRAEIVEALTTIALRGENPKKKFRIVVDYDPEFPFVAVDVFDLG